MQGAHMDRWAKAATLLALVYTTGLSAHEAPSGWQYPLECCSNSDCDVIQEAAPYGNYSVTTKMHGSVPVPMTAWSKMRPSGDGKWHICALPGADGQKSVICIFGVVTF